MRSVLKAFTSKRMAVILMLGFSSGLPLGLVGSSLQAWMTDEKVDLTLIGVFSLVGLPYTFKFVWAPFLDLFLAPFGLRRLGRRRGWMVFFQVALVLAICAMSFTSPSKFPVIMALFALLVAFASASQDIVVDAFRGETLPPDELGAGMGVGITGYRLAMITSGALALVLADHLPWSTVYLLMAAAVGLGLFAALLADEPQMQEEQSTEQDPFQRLREAVVGPFRDYFSRSGALEILLFLMLYKLGDVVAGSMITPFLLQTGFTKTDIGAVYKVFGMIATVGGGLLGGALMMRLGMRPSLVLFGVLQASTNILFAVLAQSGAHYPLLVTTVVLENLAGGMGTAAYAAFMMTLCRARFTASQYALLSSLMAVARVLASTPSGYLAKSLGWPGFFALTVFFAFPGLVMLIRYPVWARDIPKK